MARNTYTTLGDMDEADAIIDTLVKATNLEELKRVVHVPGDNVWKDVITSDCVASGGDGKPGDMLRWLRSDHLPSLTARVSINVPWVLMGDPRNLELIKYVASMCKETGTPTFFNIMLPTLSQHGDDVIEVLPVLRSAGVRFNDSLYYDAKKQENSTVIAWLAKQRPNPEGQGWEEGAILAAAGSGDCKLFENAIKDLAHLKRCCVPGIIREAFYSGTEEVIIPSFRKKRWCLDPSVTSWGALERTIGAERFATFPSFFIIPRWHADGVQLAHEGGARTIGCIPDSDDLVSVQCPGPFAMKDSTQKTYEHRKADSEWEQVDSA